MKIQNELSQKIKAIIESMTGLLVSQPYLSIEISQQLPIESLVLFGPEGILLKTVIEYSSVNKTNLQGLAHATGKDIHFLQNLMYSADSDWQTAVQVFLELAKQWAQLQSTLVYESEIIKGNAHEEATQRQEQYKKASKLFTTETETDMFLELVENKLNGIEPPKLPTPAHLDNCKGYSDGEFVILAARPGMGKTQWALNLVKTWTDIGKRGLFFSLEMSSEQLKMRLLSMYLGVDVRNILMPTEAQKKQVNAEAKKIQELNCAFLNLNTLHQIESRAKMEQIENGLDFIVIDYLQLVKSSVKGNRENEVSDISRSLKQLALFLKIPIVALSQLSRAVETRGGAKIPQLSDLRESGSLEQDADIVKFLYRPEYYGITESEEGESLIGKAMVVTAKNRSGKTGTDTTQFNYVDGFYGVENIFAEQRKDEPFVFKDTIVSPF